MGLFDSVMVECPECGNRCEHQSKADLAPYMNVYDLDDAPPHILRDCLNDPHRCAKCGTWHVLYDPQFPPNSELPRPSPKVLRVRQPTPSEFIEHEQGGDLAWWQAPFSEMDIIDPFPIPHNKDSQE